MDSQWRVGKPILKAKDIPAFTTILRRLRFAETTIKTLIPIKATPALPNKKGF